MPEAETPKLVHRRRRPAKSCEQCRKRKLKCDRGLPCSPCRRSRQALECTYGTTAKAKSPANRGRTSSLASEENHLDPKDPVHDSGDQASSTLPSVDAGTVWPSNATGAEPTPRPHLRTDQEKAAKFFGQSHWINALGQLRILSQMQIHTAYATSLHGEIMSLVKETSRIRSSIKNARDFVGNETIHDAIGTIPPKEICDELVQHYAALFEPMFRILHMPTFWAEYQTFWENREAVDKAFSLKLVMILTIGSIFCQDRVESERIRALARGWIYAVQWWLMGPTERVATSMDGVQVFCLLIIARQSNSLGGSRSITTESLLKLALLLGLHLDPSTFPSLTVFQQEMRRRLWATVLELIVMTSLDTTLPMLISPEEFTTRPPANINDSDIDPQTKEMPLERPRSEYTDCSISILLQESLHSRLRVVRKLNNTTSKISYEDTVKFGHDLGQHCRNVSRFFQNVATSGTRETTFHRKFIDSYVRRFWLFVSRLFALQARKDPRYLFARKSCLECCQIIASHSESLQLPSMAVDDFALLAMKGSGLYKGPLSQDIIVTLGLEISTQLEEEVESSKGIIDTLDPLFQLSQASRRPVIDILRHIHGQLRHIIALGRPSCKRYVMLSAILAQIDTFDSGLGDTRTEMLRVLKESIEECRGLLQDIHEKESAMNTASTPWTDGSDSWLDSMGLFGFDMNSMDLSFALGAPDIPTLNDI